MDCIFCKIIRGEIPCFKVYEDENTLAFLDIYPLYKGHTLVIPKKHAADLHEISDESLAFVVKTAKKVAEMLKVKLNCEGVNIVQSSGVVAHQTVMHFHIHVVPRFTNDGLKLWTHLGEKPVFDLKKIHAEIK